MGDNDQTVLAEVADDDGSVKAADLIADEGEATPMADGVAEPLLPEEETAGGQDWMSLESEAPPIVMRNGLRAVNRFLGGVIALVLVLVSLDMYATLATLERGLAPAEPTAGIPAAVRDNSGAAAPEFPLAKYLESFRLRPIVRNVDRDVWGTTTQVVVTPVRPPDWQAEAKGRLKLIGLSPIADGAYEAIVADRKAGRMYILRESQVFVAAETEFVLTAVHKDHVVIEKDGVSLVIK